MQQYERIKIGISSCLLGHEVRYDGGHKRDGYITGTLGLYFDFVPLCPEVGAGLGVPRPTMHLVRKEGGLRAVNIKDAAIDHTDALGRYAAAVTPQLEGVRGYILKKNSPSCGMERVKVYRLDKQNLPPERDGVGIFAGVLRERFPLLPVEEEGRLCDPVLRENFIERVFVYHRWQQLLASGLKAGDLVAFHADHKYILMVHEQDIARELGQMVAQAGNSDDFARLAEGYIHLMMTALEKRVSRGQHANALMHLVGYLKNDLVSDFRRHPQPYIGRQHYLI